MLFPVNGNSDFDRAGTALSNGVNTKEKFSTTEVIEKKKIPTNKMQINPCQQEDFIIGKAQYSCLNI